MSTRPGSVRLGGLEQIRIVPRDPKPIRGVMPGDLHGGNVCAGLGVAISLLPTLA
jgi:hypothetical protein